PDWLTVPDIADLADVRRNAIDGRIRIGLDLGPPFFPVKIVSVWPRVRAGVIRTGVKQDQFRRLLRYHGFDWTDMEADHVRDLQGAGQNVYATLWPLARVHNQAANEILRQVVTYRTPTGTILTLQLQYTPLGLYFRIVGYGAPGSTAVTLWPQGG